MADEEKKPDTPEDETEESGDQEGKEVVEAKTKTLPLKLLLFIGVPVLVLIIGGGVFFFMMGDSPAPSTEEAVAEANRLPTVDARNLVYVEVPDILVNIYSTGPRVNFLKTSVTLEVASSREADMVRALMPKILDQFLVYLRGVTIDDLRGSAGFQRLREELLLRANAVTAPLQIRDVLFKSLVIQ